MARPHMSPDVQEYYKKLVHSNELFRSDTSIFPSYTNLKVAYRVICRHRYHWSGVDQRKQFIKEIKMQEALQSRGLDGIKVHREFCNPVLSEPDPKELVRFTLKQERKLASILDTDY